MVMTAAPLDTVWESAEMAGASVQRVWVATPDNLITTGDGEGISGERLRGVCGDRWGNNFVMRCHAHCK